MHLMSPHIQPRWAKDDSNFPPLLMHGGLNGAMCRLRLALWDRSQCPSLHVSHCALSVLWCSITLYWKIWDLRQCFTDSQELVWFVDLLSEQQQTNRDSEGLKYCFLGTSTAIHLLRLEHRNYTEEYIRGHSHYGSDVDTVLKDANRWMTFKASLQKLGLSMDAGANP
jgi:hypothetical protein